MTPVLSKCPLQSPSSSYFSGYLSRSPPLSAATGSMCAPNPYEAGMCKTVSQKCNCNWPENQYHYHYMRWIDRYWTWTWMFMPHQMFRINVTVLLMQLEMNMYEAIFFEMKCSKNNRNFTGTLPPFTYISSSSCLDIKIFIIEGEVKKFFSVYQVTSKNIFSKVDPLEYKANILGTYTSNLKFLILNELQLLAFQILCAKDHYLLLEQDYDNTDIAMVYDGPDRYLEMNILQEGENMSTSSFIAMQ